MTASKISSSYVTNPRANPQVANPLGAYGNNRSRTICGTVEVATTSIDEVGDVVILARVRGNERVVSLRVYNDDMDSSTGLAVDVGLYKDVSPDGTAATVVDQDAYASAITTFQAANTVGVEVMCEARDVAKIGQTVAEDGGEALHSSDRYVAVTVTTQATTPVAGTVSWVMQVVEP